MRTIIAGSRDIVDYKFVSGIIRNSGINISMIISGGARGVDSLGVKYAKENNIVYELYLPDWDRFGKRAGFIRNCEMGSGADGLIAIWNGTSRGTRHMIDYAMNSKKIMWVYVVKNII